MFDDESDYFDQWITRYDRFYTSGSRLDREFRTSRLLVLAGRTWTHHIDNQLRRETGQSRARWQVLFSIAFAEQPVTMTELCKRARVQWPTMVRVVEDMEREGLLRREENPGDRRSRLLYLTPPGAEIVAMIKPTLDRERSQLLSLLTDEELATCLSLLEKILGAATAADRSGPVLNANCSTEGTP
jgi:MarR family transcriptional regulator for hemolysin